MFEVLPLDELEDYEKRSEEIYRLWASSMMSNFSWNIFKVIPKYYFNRVVGDYYNGIALFVVTFFIWGYFFQFALFSLFVHVPIMLLLYSAFVVVCFWSMWAVYTRVERNNECFKDIVGYYKKEGGNCWVAVDRSAKNEIVGFVGLLTARKSKLQKQGYYEIIRMCSSTKHARKGIGTQLFQKLGEYRKEGETNIPDSKFFFTSSNLQFGAIAFYQKQGYRFKKRYTRDIPVEGILSLYRIFCFWVVPIFGLVWTSKETESNLKY